MFAKVGNCLLKLLCASGEEFGRGGYRGGLSCDRFIWEGMVGCWGRQQQRQS